MEFNLREYYAKLEMKYDLPKLGVADKFHIKSIAEAVMAGNPGVDKEDLCVLLDRTVLPYYADSSITARRALREGEMLRNT